MKVDIFDDKHQIASHVARKIASLIKENDAKGKCTVLCLPTGSTPIPIYKQLIQLHQKENLSFKNVYTFNLDEYYPMKADDAQSYHYYMHHNFFQHIDIPQDHIHIPSGELGLADYSAFCEQYEQKIQSLGGLDIALLGIGRTGHIGFNEPGSKKSDRTRLVVLAHRTREDAKSSFGGLNNVPLKAVTMGIGTILDAKHIMIVATGENKASIVAKTLEDDELLPESCPAKFLKDHHNCDFLVDKSASEYLKQNQTPWLTSDLVHFTWNSNMAKRALVWLSEKTGKSIFQLTDEDFHENQLTTLVQYYNNDVDTLCREIFDDILYRIDTHTNSLLPVDPQEKVLIMSPHPDDDVISCGNTLFTLINRRNAKNITVAYQTSGCNAVSTDELKDHLRFTRMSAKALKMSITGQSGDDTQDNSVITQIIDSIKNHTIEENDLVKQLKSNVRKSEAVNALESLGLDESDAVFLDLPFYYRKGKALNDEDYDSIVNLFNKVKPDHLFIAGDLSDPHGTHGLCYVAIKEALKRYRAQGNDVKKCWLYRGAWQEYPIAEASVFVPCSKKTLDRKIYAIYKHGSQNLSPMFPGEDSREFWERARDRNMATAAKLRDLGLSSFYAVEAFYTCHELPDM